MRLDDHAYRNCHPCAGCGAEGVQVWLRATDDLCFECRGKEVMLTMHEPEPTHEMIQHHETLESYCSSEALAFEITTQEQAQIAADLINDIKNRLDFLKKQEEDLTVDFVKGIEKIHARFAPLYEAGNKGIRLWKEKLLDSARKRKEEAARALQEAQVAVAAGDQPRAAAAIIRVQPVEKVAGVTVRKVWKFEVTNLAELPPEFLMANDAAIRLVMRDAIRSGQEPEISGVRFYQEESLAATG